MWKSVLYIIITTKSVASLSLASLDNNLSRAFENISTIASIDIVNLLEKDPKSMNSSELIQYNGQPVEEHTVTTEDGYILQLFRIPKKGPTVLIVHGLFSSSDDFFVLGCKSLPIKLACLGYDVWLGNLRGNFYSKKHRTLIPYDKIFWDFSWHEMGTSDLPAMIDYILEETGGAQLTYVGHSQGTTVGYVLLSEKPEYNCKINGMVSLASVSWMSHLESPVVQLLAKFRKLFETTLKNLGLYEMLPRRIPITILMAVCGSSNLLSTICLTAIFTLSGFNYDQIDYESTGIQFGHIPSGASLKQLLHYLQNMKSGLFQKYDYGPDKNLEKYGCEEAPSYAVRMINAKMAFIYSNNDWLSNFGKDVQELVDKLPNVDEVYEVELQSFNHVDYVWAKDADDLVYFKVLELIGKYTEAGGNEECECE